MAQLTATQQCLLAFSVLALQCTGVTGLFDWVKRTAPTSPPAPSSDAPPFEMRVADEKFLVEAKQMDLSPLDSCHFKVVARLKSTCENLSEEELAKLGVVLFNCQAQVEGRRTYPCTEEMTIKQCTAEMDSDTWNAYHIVSNRARSVCYATRQQHFRRKAEMTVNALISTATSQLDAMKDLKEGQLELRDLTASSLDRLLQGHSALQAQQGALWDGQEQLGSSLKDNLDQLGKEKALIASGQELVARLVQGITNRMENVSEQLKGQGSEVQESHRAIIQDLADVRDRAQDIYHKIDHSMLGFLEYQGQTAQYYADLMGKLERMNGTLGFMLYYLDKMQSSIEGRLQVIQSYLGWAGVSLTAMWTCIMHSGYFLLVAVLLTFLHCPFFSRAALLLTVPLNAVAEVNQQPALDFTGLTLLILTLSLGHWFVNQLLWVCSRMGVKSASRPSLPPCQVVESMNYHLPSQHQCLSSTPQSECDGPMEKGDLLEDSFMPDDACIAPFSSGFVPRLGTPNQSTPRQTRRSSFSTAATDYVAPRNLGHVFGGWNESRSASPNTSLVSNSSLSSRQLCNAITKTGKACKNRASLGQEYCRVHEAGCTSYINS